MKIVTLKAYRNGQTVILAKRAITKAFTLEQFQDYRIRIIENTKFERYETELREY